MAQSAYIKKPRRLFLESLGIVIFAVMIALATNLLRSDGLPLIRPKKPPVPLPAENNQGNRISLPALKDKLAQPRGVIILDARSVEEFQAGHIPGAINLPYYDFFEKELEILQTIPLDREIITYCDGIECGNAEDLAILLQEKGYKKILVFEGGWQEWTAQGMPVAKGGEA